MCGITGIVSFNPAAKSGWIRAMTGALRHRGPDDEGYVAIDLAAPAPKATPLTGRDSAVAGLRRIEEFHEPAQIFLGHRRLAILDLSAAGHQPMRFKNLWIVFNGEIYNYLELRAELKGAGYEFSTATDTEVILAAYDRWGEDCVKRFNGDWAFALVDGARGTLFLSRDRYGVKPLYVHQGRGVFLFASEIKALLAVAEVPHALNQETAFDYCALSCRDHSGETLFAGIGQLQPGENRLVDLRGGAARKSAYYQLTANLAVGDYHHRKAISYACDIRELLIDAVRLRLRADVPVGTCLSGGLDSSTVVAIMSRLAGAEKKNLNCFTAAFPGESFDEGRYAQQVAQRAGVQSHVLYPDGRGYRENIARVLYHQDEPFGGASIYSEWAVMEEAAKHVKVILDGHGGDEVFAGYKDYRLAHLAGLWSERRWFSFAKELRQTAKMHRDRRALARELRGLPIYLLGPRAKRALYRLYYRRQIAAAARALGVGATGAALQRVGEKFAGNLNELLLHYMRTYTLPYLLRGEDRCCMAHSIEARIPFTDYRLVDYVFAIPAAYKIHRGWTKWLLRLAVSDLLPPEIVWRREKFGFATPRWATQEDEWRLWLAQHFPGGDGAAAAARRAARADAPAFSGAASRSP